MRAVLRVALIMALVAAFDYAFVQIVARHAYAWIVVAVSAFLVLAYGWLEIKRYRPRVDRSSRAWRATGETFFDPTTGAKTDVYYDATSGKRDYRASL